MKIQLSGNLIDFETPIYMTEAQRSKFIDNMREIFAGKLTVENIIENKKEMGGLVREHKKFMEEDLINLVNPSLSNYELAKQMGKTQFAIGMKRGPLYMELQEWALKKGKTKITEEDVQDFLKDKK